VASFSTPTGPGNLQFSSVVCFVSIEAPSLDLTNSKSRNNNNASRSSNPNGHNIPRDLSNRVTIKLVLITRVTPITALISVVTLITLTALISLMLNPVVVAPPHPTPTKSEKSKPSAVPS
jgi:hypothetical protein